MKIAICDDEFDFCQKIKNALEKTIGSYDTVECFSNGNELLYQAGNRIFDIVYLDIEMPGIDGIETAEKLQQINSGTLVIFVSSYSCYISKAFKINAFQFLIKEYANEDEIISEYNRAKERYCLDHYLYSVKKKDTIEKIEIKKLFILNQVGDTYML